MVERDIYEVANQLLGYVGPDTPEPLAKFLIREGEAASELADTIATLRARLETVEAERDKAAEIAEAYRSAMLDTETLLNSLPVPISSTGDTSLVWKRVSDAADRLRAARHDVIYSHGPFAIRNLEPRHD